MKIQMSCRKLSMVLAGGTGTRHWWVTTHGHAVGLCLLPVPSGYGWRKFWGRCPG